MWPSCTSASSSSTEPSIRCSAPPDNSARRTTSAVRSGDVRRLATAGAMLLLVGTLGGCVETTQQKNARAQLQDDRLLASRSGVQVTRRDPNVAVMNVRTLRSPAGGAIAVTLRNDGERPVSDLPVSVGVSTPAGRTTYLNRQPELPYFQTHVAGIAGKARA